MALKDDADVLRDATAMSLSAADDQFIYIKKLWRFVDIEICRRGRKIVLDNNVTSFKADRGAFTAAGSSVCERLFALTTIQQIVSLTETFLTDFASLLVTDNSFHLEGQVDVQAIVAAPGKAAILARIIDSYLMFCALPRSGS